MSLRYLLLFFKSLIQDEQALGNILLAKVKPGVCFALFISNFRSTLQYLWSSFLHLLCKHNRVILFMCKPERYPIKMHYERE